VLAARARVVDSIILTGSNIVDVISCGRSGGSSGKSGKSGCNS
jgi:hypothetical protein